MIHPRIAGAVRMLLGCLALASTAGAQSIMSGLDGASWPIGIENLERTLNLAGVNAPPRVVWECHGGYLSAIHDSGAEARALLLPLGVDGTRYEKPESVRRAIVVTRGAIAREELAIDALVACLSERLPESQRAKLDFVRSELVAQNTVSWGLSLGPPNERGFSGFARDIRWFLDELPLSDEEIELVRPILASFAPRREKAGRAMAESGLSWRMRMAKRSEEFGVAGMADDEASPILRKVAQDRDGAWRDAASAARANGAALPPRPVDPNTELLLMRGCSREAAFAAVVTQRDLVEAVAQVLRPDSAKRLRRAFRHHNLGLDSMIDGQSWSMNRPRTPAVMWTARRVLSQPEVRGERRAKALAILEQWADAEDAIKEKLAKKIVDDLSKPEVPHQEGGMNDFYPGQPPIEELVETARPFESQLAALLGMPWISDSSLDAPPIPGASSLPKWSREESLLTGGSQRAEVADSWWVTPPRPRGWTGWRPIDETDLESWSTILDLDDAMKPLVDSLFMAHRREWSERVDAVLAAASAQRPYGQAQRAAGGGMTLTTPEGLEQWREAALKAIPEVDALALAADASFFEMLRAALPPTERWRVDAIEFSRVVDAYRAIELRRVHRAIESVEDQLFGGRCIDPVAALLRSGLPPDRTRELVRALVPELAELKAAADEERRWLIELSLETTRGEPLDHPDEIAKRHLDLQRRALANHQRWRDLERAKLAALVERVPPGERASIERAAQALRFPSALGTITTAARIAHELRAAALEEPVTESDLHAIAEIDRAEQALASEIERRAAPVIAEYGTPAPAPDSVESLMWARSARMNRASSGRVPLLESERFAWYLVRVLPPEISARSPMLRRLAILRGVSVATPTTIALP